MDKGGKYTKGIYPRISQFPNPLLLGRLILDKEELVFDKENRDFVPKKRRFFLKKEREGFVNNFL